MLKAYLVETEWSDETLVILARSVMDAMTDGA